MKLAELSDRLLRLASKLDWLFEWLSDELLPGKNKNAFVRIFDYGHQFLNETLLLFKLRREAILLVAEVSAAMFEFPLRFDELLRLEFII